MKVKCIDVSVAPGYSVAPPLELGKEYNIKNVVNDSKGNPHWDVGLVSEYNFVTSRETGEELPNGDLIHWCHPSRFEIIS